jgi:aminopeptidase C
MGRRVPGKILEGYIKYIRQIWPFFTVVLGVPSLGFAYFFLKKIQDYTEKKIKTLNPLDFNSEFYKLRWGFNSGSKKELNP